MVCTACKSYYTNSAVQAPAATTAPAAPSIVVPKPCMKCATMKALQLGALFFVIANPEVYKLTGGDVLLHSLVFAIVILVMSWKGLI